MLLLHRFRNTLHKSEITLEVKRNSCSRQTLKMQVSTQESKEFNKNDYKVISEGKANAYFPLNEQVFYNPIQEFNRDLSIAVINTHSQKHNVKLRLLEALAASGIRSMRYALEIDNIEKIIANDFDQKAVDLINSNIDLNNVREKVSANCADAISLMHDSCKSHSTKFNCIDLDPYGSPSPFLDSAMRSIKNGGLMLVTATDAAVLCGNGADACYTKYGAVSLRTPFCHELGLRILLQSINSHAIRYSKYIVPLLSLSIDFYFRIFFLVFDGQLKAKESTTKIGFAYVCSGCQSYCLQPFGTAEPTKNNFKFLLSHAPSVPTDKCVNCSGRFHLAGPLWLAPLHDKSFVADLLSHIQEKSHLNYSTKDRMVGMLNLAREELDEPFYYDLSEMCSVMHCVMPNHDQFRSALMNANHSVSYSHCNRNSIKTDAPSLVLWDILKQWVVDHPVNQKWLNQDHRVYHIINRKNSAETTYDFTIRKDAVPKSKIEKLIRFHEPPPFWGPGKRAKARSDSVPNENKNKKKREAKSNAEVVSNEQQAKEEAAAVSEEFLKIS